MMFDPTIFDNLKVVLEGAVYDMDLNDTVVIIGRTDRIELSSMSRSFSMTMARKEAGVAEGSFMLTASVADLAAELLADSKQQPGCSLELSFVFPIADIERDCSESATMIGEIWGVGPQLSQCIMMEYGEQPRQMKSKLVVKFVKKLDERHIDDIPSLLEHFYLCLERLDGRISE
ncbi:hypothetical protein [Paenibacillus periandrae]|uniref:hypothetical protein n=1 Tax=Paenibacillus periandrae TaxID=1761741 RepID=UPI001F08EFEC|nr:hypothetical protein [Paenibacillus periandrae]